MENRKTAIDKVTDFMLENNLTPVGVIPNFVEKKYPKSDDDELLNTKQICKVLGISRSTLYRRIEEGMPYYEKEGLKTGRLYSKQQCIAFQNLTKRAKKKERELINEQV